MASLTNCRPAQPTLRKCAPPGLPQGSPNPHLTAPGACRCICMQDFLGSQTHPVGWDGRNTTYMWVRGNNTARSILNIRDASCGMWVRTPEGDFAGFSGAQGAAKDHTGMHTVLLDGCW